MKKRHQALLPWLLTDRLDDEERREVEASLADDAEAEGLLAYARLLQRAVREESGEVEVSSRLLVEYVDHPDRLPQDVKRRIEEALKIDPRAGEAVAILRRLAAVPEPVGAVVLPGRRESSGMLRALWVGLRGLLLQPVPAFAHLVVLAVAGLLVWLALQTGAGPGSAGGGVVQLASVEAEVRLRGTDRGEETMPTVVPFRTDSPVVLELVTGLDLEDSVSPAIDLEITGPEDFALRRRLGGWDFEEGSVLRLLLPGDPAPTAGRYEVEMRYDAPGTPLDGQLAFRATLDLRP